MKSRPENNVMIYWKMLFKEYNTPALYWNITILISITMRFSGKDLLTGEKYDVS